jgi:hypothetical protein
VQSRIQASAGKKADLDNRECKTSTLSYVDPIADTKIVDLIFFPHLQ